MDAGASKPEGHSAEDNTPTDSMDVGDAAAPSSAEPIAPVEEPSAAAADAPLPMDTAEEAPAAASSTTEPTTTGEDSGPASASGAASSDVADYIVFAQAPKRAPAPTPAASREPGDPAKNPEGLRPAFGFMPDYEGEDEGVLVGQVFEGRPAFEAGIEEGDRILAINGMPTLDLEEYTEVLDTLIIGRTVTVRVRREEAEVDLQVEVGSRAAR